MRKMRRLVIQSSKRGKLDGGENGYGEMGISC